MTRSVIFLAFIIPTITGYSQYHRFIDESKIWVESYNSTDLEDIRPGSYSVSFAFFKGDSIINEKIFSKFYKQQFYLDTWYTSNASHLIDDTLKQPQLFALVREDTLLKKVFDVWDRILYDFSLNIEDTLHNYIGQYVVDNIIDIQINNGDLRKKFYFKLNESSDISSYIEGIGGDNGIIEPFYIPGLSGFETSGDILCYSENSLELYGTCNFPDYKIVDIFENTINNKVGFYPNPILNEVLIDLHSYYSSIVIDILDLSGKTIEETTYSHTSRCQVDLSKFNKGIYILRILMDNEQCKTIKIIKN